jgi:hypothetical protein
MARDSFRYPKSLFSVIVTGIWRASNEAGASMPEIQNRVSDRQVQAL